MPMTTPEAVGLSSERLARVRPALEKYVGDDKLAGALTLIARRGEIVHRECVGLLDREHDLQMRPDALFRIYSMTKPIVCVALMTLYEQGGFQLLDPVSKYIPAFADLKVYAGQEGTGVKLENLQLEALEREVTVRDLLTHTSGLTYHFTEYGPVEEMYRQAGISSQKPLSEFVADLLTMPLAFQPGTTFRYSFAHDVAAHLIEVLSGQPVDAYLRERLFEPLGMVDTGYWVPVDKRDRLATMYGAAEILEPDMTVTRLYQDVATAGSRRVDSSFSDVASGPHNVLRGGHGLVSTAQDYYRFCQMLHNGGELAGARILSRKTLELMTANHLAPELLPYEIGNVVNCGYGYGLGFRVAMDLGQCQILGSQGEFGWGGAASTYFWIDPREEFIGVLMAQFQPNGHYQIANDFRVAAYQAIVD
jgi:CubicO group peptidase (beta-lactamase class C family)